MEGRPVQSADVLADPEYTYYEQQKRAGFRTLLAAPLLRDGHPVGVFLLGRKTVRPFDDQQIALVSTFADQAVIAIENVRLFEEVQARTSELTELLEQQTATSEVLSVISSSAGELEPVFQKMLENATRVCGAQFGTMNLYDGEKFSTVGSYNVPPAYADTQLQSILCPAPQERPGNDCENTSAGPDRGYQDASPLSRAQRRGGRALRPRRRANDCHRADAQGR